MALETRRAAILERMSRTANDDGAAEEELLVREMPTFWCVPESQELVEIDAALRRVSSGTFGQCEGCGQAIGLQRLRALPETRFCISCGAHATAA